MQDPPGEAIFALSHVRSDGQGAGRPLLGRLRSGAVLPGLSREPPRACRHGEPIAEARPAVRWRCFPAGPRRQKGQFASVSLCVLGAPSGAVVTFGGNKQRILLAEGTELRWTGRKFVAYDNRRAEMAALPLGQRVQADLRAWRTKLQRAFFPLDSSVTPDYWEYAQWRATQRIFTSMLSILATQAMLEAVGVGAQRSLPAAATLNWVLKDGLGKLGKISVAAVFGRGFDSDLKAARFRSSCLYSACIFLEVVTPFFPQHFLPLATVAMVGKSVGYTTHVATQPAFNKSMSRGEHLAEISAKTQAQQTVSENIGLALVVLIRMAIRSKPRLNTALPLLLFPALATGDLYSISRELHAIELRTINRQRGELIAEHWVKENFIPSQRQVARQECLIPPLLPRRGSLPLTVEPIVNLASEPAELDELLQLYKREKFLLNIEPRPKSSRQPVTTPADFGARRIHLTLEGSATGSDILLSLLQAAHLRALCKSPASEGSPEQELVRQSLAAARRDIKPFLQGLRDTGWEADTFMLSSDDRDRCTYRPTKS